MAEAATFHVKQPTALLTDAQARVRQLQAALDHEIQTGDLHRQEFRRAYLEQVRRNLVDFKFNGLLAGAET